jgi:hypothetical protein
LLLESPSSKLFKLSVVQSQRPQRQFQAMPTIFPPLLISSYGFIIG